MYLLYGFAIAMDWTRKTVLCSYSEGDIGPPHIWSPATVVQHTRKIVRYSNRPLLKYFFLLQDKISSSFHLIENVYQS